MDKERDITQSLLMKQILDEISNLKSKMPNGELRHMQDGMEEMKKNFKEMKDDMSELKKKLLDPDDGVIVKVNENTKFRLEEESRYDENMAQKADLEAMKKWQSGVNKALWIIFGAIIAIALKIIFGVSG
jgi:ABC-type Fe3+-citrate transport system substrate-binding protein